MRRTALFLAMAVAITSLVGLTSSTAYAAPAAPVASDPNPYVGQSVTLTGNLGVTGARTIELQNLYSTGWKKYASGKTASDGSYSFSASTTAPERQFRVYAKASGSNPALTSDAVTLTTKAYPNPPAPTVTPATPWAGQNFTISGNFGAPVARSIELQNYYSTGWKKYASGKTDASGNYSFTANTTAAERPFRVIAKASGSLPALTSEQLVVTTQSDDVTLNVVRLGGSTAKAAGLASLDRPGRLFALQVKSGSKWVQVGDKAAQGAAGAVSVSFPVNGDKTYRLVGDPIEGSSGAVSASVAFKPGPSFLGKNVLYVTTDNGKNPTTKGVPYTGSAVVVAGDKSSNALEVEEFAVRGNSTADKAKKPYKLKFPDKELSSDFKLFEDPTDTGGFERKKDKTWILLANYGDWSLIRTRIGSLLGRQQNGLKWTPRDKFVELFVNGKYVGSYQLIESIKIDSNRVNVSKTKGQIIEFDPHWKEDGVPGFKSSQGLNYAWKDPEDKDPSDPEKATPQKIADMTAKIKKFESVLYARDWSKYDNFKDTLAPEDDWVNYLDLASAVDYNLVKEFTKDNDADFYRSNYFFTNDVTASTFDDASINPTTGSPAKFFMGPVWDFDRSAGAAPAGGTNIASPTGWWTRGNGSVNHDTNKIHWFTRISKDPRFLKALQDRWLAKRAQYKAVALTGVGDAVRSMAGSSSIDDGYKVGNNDRGVWSKYGTRYAAKTSSYKNEIAWVRTWYKDRYNWMDAQIAPSNKDQIGTLPPI